MKKERYRFFTLTSNLEPQVVVLLTAEN